jgi:hypothetical protein
MRGSGRSGEAEARSIAGAGSVDCACASTAQPTAQPIAQITALAHVATNLVAEA